MFKELRLEIGKLQVEKAKLQYEVDALKGFAATDLQQIGALNDELNSQSFEADTMEAGLRALRIEVESLKLQRLADVAKHDRLIAAMEEALRPGSWGQTLAWDSLVSLLKAEK